MVTMPVWLTWGLAGLVTGMSYPMWGIPGWVFYPAMFFGCGGSLLTLLNNRIIITAHTISLPSFWGASRLLKELDKVSLATSLGGELHFEANARHCEVWQAKPKLYLPIRKLNRARLNTLVQALRQRAPHCQIEADLCIKSFPQAQQAKSPQEAGTVTIKYRSHEKVIHLIQSLLFCEKKILPYWIFVSFLPLLIIAPFLVYSVLNPHSPNYYGRPSLLTTYSDYVGKCLTAVGNSFSSYSNIFSNPLLICSAAVAFLTTFLVLCKFLLQPNSLRLSATELSLRIKLGWFEVAQRCPWAEISSIDLAADENFINVHNNRGKALQLKLDAINIADRQRVVAALDRFAPEVKRDARFLEAMTPPQQSSYTELWLQSLSTPPKRNNLLPLADGHLVRDGKYKVVRQLGTGGQGSAYLADVCDVEGEQIVLKEFILPVYVEDQVRKLALEKFDQEARLLKQLDHGQIVKMMDHFLEDHRAYLVLQHIDGYSLRHIMESTACTSLPDSNWVIDLGLQMCDILEFLHSLTPPLVHRDFTPDNLILDRDGTLKLIDFDVAQQREQTTSATVVGKHAYLPPEQFRGKPCPQSDLYALGATLHFLLTGCDPEPLTSSHPLIARPDIATALDGIVAACTQLDLSKRYETAARIKQDLQNIQCPCGSADPGDTIKVKETAACE